MGQKRINRYFLYVWVLIISFSFSQNVDYKQIPQKNNFQLIIDKSGSMSGAAISDAKAGAKYFVSKMENIDAAGVIAFSSSIEDVVSFTSHKSSLNSGIASISVGGATHLYDVKSITKSGTIQLNSNLKKNLSEELIFLKSETEFYNARVVKRWVKNNHAYVKISDNIPQKPPK